MSALDDAELTRVVEMGGMHAPDAPTMPGWLYTISPDDREALVGCLRALARTAGANGSAGSGGPGTDAVHR